MSYGSNIPQSSRAFSRQALVVSNKRNNYNVVMMLMFFLLCMATITNAQPFVENSPLSANSPANCEAIIESSSIMGTCCSLSDTEGGGCVLNVVNGNCKIRGQYWVLDFTSTFSEGGITCPEGDYDDLLNDDNENEDGNEDEDDGDDEDEDEDGTPDAPSGNNPPANDQCINAILLEPNVEITGDTTLATFDFNNPSQCGLGSDSSGIWYELVGRDRNVSIHLCSNNGRSVTFGIFSECDSLVVADSCFGFPDNNGTAAANSCRDIHENRNFNTSLDYSFFAESGQSYFIHVRDHASSMSISQGAKFTLAYTEQVERNDNSTVPPADFDIVVYCGNEPCTIPVPITCGRLIADYDFFGSCCSLVSDVDTGGCSVFVWQGECAWIPKCIEQQEECIDEIGCNTLYQTNATNECVTAGSFLDPFNPLPPSGGDDIPEPTTCAPTGAAMGSPPPTNAPEVGNPQQEQGPTASDFPIEYCGNVPCVVPVPIPCESLIADYEFFGSCCSLQSIASSGGCRVTVWQGECAWIPKCSSRMEQGEDESCEDEISCNTVFRTDALSECIVSTSLDPFNPPSDLLEPTCAPAGAVMSPPPTPTEENNGGGIPALVENFPLYIDSPVSCGDIIESSTFEGDCCSLNATAGGGCILNVVDGRCVVRGPFWTLDYTSTYSFNGATCPPSEFDAFPPPQSTDVPENGRCINATILEEGEEVIGDNSNASYDFISQGICGALSDRRAVWYMITGSGIEVEVSVCSNNNVLTTFGIFARCDDLTCVGSPGESTTTANCDDGESVSYSFMAEDGESYFIHVRSDVTDGGIGSNFTIVYRDAESSSLPSTSPSNMPSDAPSLVPSQVSSSNEPTAAPTISEDTSGDSISVYKIREGLMISFVIAIASLFLTGWA